MCLSTVDTTLIKPTKVCIFCVLHRAYTLEKKKKRDEDKQYIKYNCYEKLKQNKAYL